MCKAFSFVFCLAIATTSLLTSLDFISLQEEEISQENAIYLSTFPFSQYTILNVAGQGLFYVDERDDCIKNTLKRGKRWEANIESLIFKYVKPGATVLDIGAHIGTHTMTLSRCVGQKGKVIAFEPQRKIFRELVMNLKLNDCTNVTPYRYALGAENAWAYLDKPLDDNEGARFISLHNKDEKIAMRTLDSFNLNNISFIKIDVENYEGEVLDGAKQTILRCKPVILIEIQGNYVQASLAASDGPALMQERANINIAKIKALGYDVTHFECNDYLAIPQ